MAVRTPLVRLNADAPVPIYLKLENLQPVGSFKLRGAANALCALPPADLGRGVYTASAGNMAQGVAWAARALGVPATAVVPETAPATKLRAIERLGARALKVPFDRWWQVMIDHHFPGLDALFVHPFADTRVMAGNGTIALELLEDLPEVETVLVPYGGGGLSCGIAATLAALRPQARVFGCEVDAAAPLVASFAAGEARSIDYRPNFVDGISGKSVMAEMWPLTRRLLAGARAVSVAEGAGAVPVAAALVATDLRGPVVCIVSGGNIDSDKLATILAGGVP